LAQEARPYGIHVNAISPAAHTRLGYAAQMGETGWENAGMLPDTSAHPEMAALAASAVCWLAHATCELSGEVVTAAGQRLARVVISETAGAELTDPQPESIRGLWPAASGTAELFEPKSLEEWTARCGIPTSMSRYLASRGS
jgi:hypothetical protein